MVECKFSKFHIEIYTNSYMKKVVWKLYAQCDHWPVGKHFIFINTPVYTARTGICSKLMHTPTQLDLLLRVCNQTRFIKNRVEITIDLLF